MKQLSMLKDKVNKVFGGSLLVGKRKSKRPLSTKHAILLTLRSDLVVSLGTFARHAKFVERLLHSAAKRWGIRIYRFAIEANHIHLLIKIPNRIAYNSFVQYFTGVLSSRINKGRLKKFWTYRPHTRIVEWGRDFRRACNYVEMNTLEALGWIEPQPRGIGASQQRAHLKKNRVPSYKEFLDANALKQQLQFAIP